MNVQEIIAVAAVVLAAFFYLVRLTVSKSRKRDAENSCGGCGCGKIKAVNKPSD